MQTHRPVHRLLTCATEIAEVRADKVQILSSSESERTEKTNLAERKRQIPLSSIGLSFCLQATFPFSFLNFLFTNVVVCKEKTNNCKQLLF